nr:integrase, catalytic region, zinc finger, CCHC-type, peptidase aspartic, catalytic [Tanacetum cinerariifolium]
MNKIKKDTFAEPIVSSITNHETYDSNKPTLHSTGVKCSTSASRSKPSGNTKNNRIWQPSSSNKINKVEDQPRSVKTRKNNKNRVKKVKCDDRVMQSMSNANSVYVSIHNAHVTNSVNDVKSGNRSQLMNFVSKILGTLRFGNNQIARIMWYGDYQLENVIISRVYYVEGLRRNLFSIGQFCDADLEVAFRKNTCFIRNLEGVDLLFGSCDIDLYIISLDDMLKSFSICLLSKASKTKSWLWNQRLSHLNFGKRKESSHQPKAEDTNQEKLYLLHMDLCGPMRVASIKGKKVYLSDSQRLLKIYLGKRKESSHQPKAEDTNQEKLYLLHMDLCGPMRVASIKRKRLNEIPKTLP